MPGLMRTLLLASVLAVSAVAGGSAAAYTSAAPIPVTPVTWQKPTPARNASPVAVIGQPFTLTLRAADATPGASVHIAATSALPPGAALTVADGNPATATLTWTATDEQRGDYPHTFTATDNAATPSAAPARTITIRVRPEVERVQLSGGIDNVSRWAYVARTAVVRAAPSPKARVVGKLTRWTPEWYPNLALALEQVVDVRLGTWVRVRLAKLPNNSTGWVKRGSLSGFRQVTTRLLVDRRALRATLYKDGLPVFKTIVGVGRNYWPTPHGEFYVREKLTGFKNPMYGPIAFGLNARSAVLTDWPGGGFIGIHGTNEPGILPGRVSHGCIRMRNPSILRLARMMPLGTPVTVR
jgi:hypothetical protein